MSDHLSRKELKQDNVALKVEETTHFLVTHRPQAIRAGIAVLVVLLVGFGSWFFITSRRDAREQALGAALTMENAPVGESANGGMSFPSETAKEDAILKAFNSIINQNGGSEEAYAAEYYLAGIDVTNGKFDEALKKYDHVAAGAGADYASLAKLGKAQVLLAVGRASEAQTLLRDLMAHPTSMVSKDQAAFALAQALTPTQPDEARKLLLPIAAENSEVSQTAVTALAALPQAK